MPDNIETLDETASAEVEQPVEEQADEQVVEETEGEQAPSEEETVSEPEPQPKLFANKYKSPEELERAYQESNAENSRMAARLAAIERQSTPVKTDPPKYTTEQLESYKETRLREIAKYENQASRLQADGRYDEAMQAAGLAHEAARQIRLIDAELRQMDIRSFTQQTTKQSAEQRLLGDAVGVLKQYQADLVEGTPLFNKASEFLSGYEAMGLDPKNALVQAQAVAMAANILGLSAKKVEQTTRKELTKTINQALKQGVQAGAGKAAKSAAQPDWENMTDAEFIAEKRKRGLN
jgi:hypothetical protein